MPRLRRLRSAQTETDLRETNRQTGKHGVAELGWKPTLFHQLASCAVGQGRRRQRAIPSWLQLGREGIKTGLCPGFYCAQARPTAPHALWFDEAWFPAHRRRQINVGEASAPRIL